ncbi:MAG: DUF2088 domain-containing protein [Chloroflexi bacterium]|nr:MAG: DUF2088 domain-containing protein [Chloroflexota bacterium]
MQLPRLATIRQHVPSAPLPDVAQAVRDELARINLGQQIKPGARIAVGAGSRGITNYALIVGTVIAELRRLGAEPFVFAAMGSHGGATTEGQREILTELGISEERMGCPILTDMAVVQLGTTTRGLPVFCDANAYRSDGIMLINRIKLHTDFHGPTESGLHKMLAIGLGKRQGAELIHADGVPGLREHIPQVAAVQLAQAPILGGLAIIEDGMHQVSHVRAVPAQAIPHQEPQLLEMSRQLMATLPVDHCHVLIVDWIGKDISGAGMDSNVIGRIRIDGEIDPLRPQIDQIVALRLTPASHGNAIGTGFADVIAQGLLDAMDAEITRINLVTSGFLRRGDIPKVQPTEHAAIMHALAATHRDDATIVRIRSTLQLDELQVSENLLADLLRRPGIELVHPPEPMRFRGNGTVEDWD